MGSRGIYVVFAYALVNFFLVFGNTDRYPRNGVPEVVEYRGFSGHWMLFYYVGTATLYSAIRLGPDRPRCPNGHDVSLFAKHCDICGVEVPPLSLW